MLGTVQERLAARRTGVPLDRLKRVLLAALAAPCYARRLERAGLGTARAIRVLDSVEQGIEALAPVEFREWQSWGAPIRGRRGRKWWHGSISRRILTGSSGWLLEAARGSAPPAAAHSVIALTGFGADPLSEAERDELWKCFRVPVFERLVGPDGQAFAAECPAHEGLHAFSERAVIEGGATGLVVTSLTSLRHPALRVSTGIAFHLQYRRCPCGETTWLLGRGSSKTPPATLQRPAPLDGALFPRQFFL